MGEVIQLPVIDAVVLDGAALVFDDDGNEVGVHELVSLEDPISTKISRLYTETKPADLAWFSNIQHRTLCSVACHLRGTEYATVARHASDCLHEEWCSITDVNLDRVPAKDIDGDRVRYRAQTHALFCVPGIDHTDHRPYVSGQGYEAMLIPESQNLAMTSDLHPALSNAGVVNAKKFGWSSIEDSKGRGRVGVPLLTSADISLVRVPAGFEKGFDFHDFVTDLPTEQTSFEAYVYGYAQLNTSDEYILNNYLAVETGIKTITDIRMAMQRTLLPNKLTRVRGMVHLFPNNGIGLFCASVEAGFSHGPIIHAGKVYGWIVGHMYADNRNLIILAAHPAFQHLCAIALR